MGDRFDRRVVDDSVLEVMRACQRRAACHLGGGAALSGAHLGHRLSADIDLVCHDAAEVRSLVRALPDVAGETDAAIALVRDAGTFARADVRTPTRKLELDIVYEGTPDLEPPLPTEGVAVESLADLRAAKLTCLLSRSEPRDLVDLLFLDRAGFPPERDLPRAVPAGGRSRAGRRRMTDAATAAREVLAAGRLAVASSVELRPSRPAPPPAPAGRRATPA